jgi:hypothetical protein
VKPLIQCFLVAHFSTLNFFAVCGLEPFQKNCFDNFRLHFENIVDFSIFEVEQNSESFIIGESCSFGFNLGFILKQSFGFDFDFKLELYYSFPRLDSSYVTNSENCIETFSECPYFHPDFGFQNLVHFNSCDVFG